jgi:hypothetical protein
VVRRPIDRTGVVPPSELGPDDADRRRRLAAVLRRTFTSLSRSPRKESVRVFHPVELSRISTSARGLLLRMASEGSMTHRQREEALSVALWLEQPDVNESDMEQIVRFLLDRDGTRAPRARVIPQAFASVVDLDPKRWN